VRLEDSPFTEDYGLLSSDVPLLETMIDATLTEYIAAKLEGRGTGNYDIDDMQARIAFATGFQREAFENRVEHAVEGAFKTAADDYAADAERRSRRRSSHDYSPDTYEQERRMREAQRKASEPTTQLPTNR